MRWSKQVGLPVCFASLVVACGAARALPTYMVTDLGVLGTHAEGQPLGVNDSGQVSGGKAEPSGDVHAFLFSNGSMQNVGKPGETYSAGIGINNAGTIAVDSGSGAFVYSNGNRININPVAGTTFGPRPEAINSNGQVTGWIVTGPSTSTAFLYSNGITRDIGTLGGDNASANGINDLGQVVGGSQTSNSSSYHAFLYNNGVMGDLGTLGGPNSFAYDINNSGQIIGSSTTAAGLQHAFLFSNGRMEDLGVFFPTDINNLGQAVGQGTSGHATLFSDGFFTDLDALPSVRASGWDVLQQANAISDKGYIVGLGAIHGEALHGFLLSPVGEAPEPPAIALMATGMLALLRFRRKRASATT